MSNRALSVAAFLAAAIPGAAGATSAVPPDSEQKSVVVHYQPADLGSSAGADRLYHTLSDVARVVCADGDFTIELTVRKQQWQCEQGAIASAVSRVSSASLTAAYNRHYPNQPLLENERLSERPRAPIILVVG